MWFGISFFTLLSKSFLNPKFQDLFFLLPMVPLTTHFPSLQKVQCDNFLNRCTYTGTIIHSPTRVANMGKEKAPGIGNYAQV